MGNTRQYGGSWHRVTNSGCSNQFGGRWRNGGYVAPCPNPDISVCITPYVDNAITKIYLSANDGKIYSYNVVDDAFVEECGSIFGVSTIGYHPDGAIYGIHTNGDIYRVKLSNDTSTLVDNVSIGYIAVPGAIAAEGIWTAYVCSVQVLMVIYFIIVKIIPFLNI